MAAARDRTPAGGPEPFPGRLSATPSRAVCQADRFPGGLLRFTPGSFPAPWPRCKRGSPGEETEPTGGTDAPEGRVPDPAGAAVGPVCCIGRYGRWHCARDSVLVKVGPAAGEAGGGKSVGKGGFGPEDSRNEGVYPPRQAKRHGLIPESVMFGPAKYDVLGC